MKRSKVFIFALLLPCASFAGPRAISGLEGLEENVPIKTVEMAKKEADAQKAAQKAGAPKHAEQPRLASDSPAGAAAPQSNPSAPRAEQK